MGVSSDCERRSVGAHGSASVHRGVELYDCRCFTSLRLFGRLVEDRWPDEFSNARNSPQFVTTVPHLQGAYKFGSLEELEIFSVDRVRCRALLHGDVELSSIENIPSDSEIVAGRSSQEEVAHITVH